jgi:hypothetical protein
MRGCSARIGFKFTRHLLETMDLMPCSRPIDILNTPFGAVGNAVHLPMSMPRCDRVVFDVCPYNVSIIPRFNDR